ncbi:MAG: DUF1365 domain-containing protein [Halieaceae bacterium]|nr:DUF1365 domain-containing protein [Halieaceae bacterium]
MKSRLYEGVLRHRRIHPKEHAFQYRVFMPYICLSELAEVFDDIPFWSQSRPALGRFRRSDFLGDPAVPLEDEVRRRIFEETGATQKGDIYLLANLRYFGHIANPIAVYYCFNEDESNLEWVVAEVTNTPWEERHSYVLPGPAAGKWLNTQFDKTLHVSPFNPMAMQYHWRSNTPDHRLVLHMDNHHHGEKVFDATLTLSALPFTAGNLNRLLARYPFMTVKVVWGIYWQALKLYLKGVPVFAHP